MVLNGLFNKNTPLIMGVLNVTPDSFSDGGQYFTPENAIERGLRMIEDGADIIDIGGESTRPNADIIPVDEEIRRVIPVVLALKAHAPLISIDTRNAATMRAAMDVGAHIINDVSGLTYDPQSIAVAADTGAHIVIMHSIGTPQTMQYNPQYDDVVEAVDMFFKTQIARCAACGIDGEKIILDVGIGFGKTLQHNIKLLQNLSRFHDLGYPLLLGTSRKSFISDICGGVDIHERRAGTIASGLWGVSQGVKILRVHDVAQMRQAVDVNSAIANV